MNVENFDWVVIQEQQLRRLDGFLFPTVDVQTLNVGQSSTAVATHRRRRPLGVSIERKLETRASSCMSDRPDRHDSLVWVWLWTTQSVFLSTYVNDLYCTHTVSHRVLNDTPIQPSIGLGLTPPSGTNESDKVLQPQTIYVTEHYVVHRWTSWTANPVWPYIHMHFSFI